MNIFQNLYPQYAIHSLICGTTIWLASKREWSIGSPGVRSMVVKFKTKPNTFALVQNNCCRKVVYRNKTMRVDFWISMSRQLQYQTRERDPSKQCKRTVSLFVWQGPEMDLTGEVRSTSSSIEKKQVFIFAVDKAIYYTKNMHSV